MTVDEPGAEPYGAAKNGHRLSHPFSPNRKPGTWPESDLGTDRVNAGESLLGESAGPQFTLPGDIAMGDCVLLQRGKMATL